MFLNLDNKINFTNNSSLTQSNSKENSPLIYNEYNQPQRNLRTINKENLKYLANSLITLSTYSHNALTSALLEMNNFLSSPLIFIMISFLVIIAILIFFLVYKCNYFNWLRV